METCTPTPKNTPHLSGKLEVTPEHVVLNVCSLMMSQLTLPATQYRQHHIQQPRSLTISRARSPGSVSANVFSKPSESECAS